MPTNDKIKNDGNTRKSDFAGMLVKAYLVILHCILILCGLIIWRMYLDGPFEGVEISEQSILEAAKNKYIELSSNPNIDKTEAAKAVAIQYNLAYFALGRGRLENTKCVEVLELEAISIPGALNSDCLIDDGIVTGSSGKSDYNKRAVYSNGSTVWGGMLPGKVKFVYDIVGSFRDILIFGAVIEIVLLLVIIIAKTIAFVKSKIRVKRKTVKNNSLKFDDKNADE